jgi:ferritin
MRGMFFFILLEDREMGRDLQIALILFAHVGSIDHPEEKGRVMLGKAVRDSLNEQIKKELDSAYLYLSMSAYCESENLPGFAKWLRVQWEEEIGHGMKLFGFVIERGGQVTLQAIEKPQTKWKSPLEVFEHVAAHEQKVSASINSVYEVALKEGDYATQVELQWFIKEQVEEEKAAGEIVHLIRLAGTSGPSLLMLDRQLGARVKG